jgi:hypothetical protein
MDDPLDPVEIPMTSITGKNMGDGWETARRLDRPPILKTLPDNPNILVKITFIALT